MKCEKSFVQLVLFWTKKMQECNPFKMSCKQKLNMFITIVSVIWTMFFLVYFFWWWELLWSLLVLSLYIFILYGVVYLYKRIRKQETPYLKPFFVRWYIRIARLFLLFLIIMFAFTKYQNEINPVSTPIYTLTNWERNIQFQTVMHIWTAKYYSQLLSSLKHSKENWYVLYYEWVVIDDDKKADKFNTALWVNFGASFYESFSKLYWLEHQDNSIFMEVVNDKDFNVDIPISKVIDIYEQKYWEIIYDESKILNVTDVMIQRLASMKEHQLLLLRTIFKSSINFMVKHDNIQSQIVKLLQLNRIIDIILEERNDYLANYILNSDDKNIHVMYGKLHFKWVLERLQKADPRWKVVGYVDAYPTVE